MLYTIDEIAEKADHESSGVSFEEALKRTSKDPKFKVQSNAHCFLIEFGKFHHLLIIISGLVMASAFFEMMSVNYALPVAECDLNITSKQQYGIISGLWFAGATIQ